jgi:valyl-tRNA synthetase
MTIPPGTPLAALARTSPEQAALFREAPEVVDLVRYLANLDRFEAGPDVAKPDQAASEVVAEPELFAGIELYVPLEGLIDTEAERQRLEDRLAKEREFLGRLEKKLANRGFVEKAPEEVVQRERDRAEEVRGRIAALEANLADLG